VLLVDDNLDILELNEIRLGDRYDLRSANDGASAIDQLDNEIDVVVLNRRMPGVSGNDVLEAIRERDLSCAVIILSGLDPDKSVDEPHVDAYLTKPVSGDDLRATIDALL